ncbi:MAG TPA: winged helix-turn-helix domain-containing protein [Capillimicrobium sp.]|nr:winged helix-turn-helix domain-containing protein [Capillimicrobium sp.]
MFYPELDTTGGMPDDRHASPRHAHKANAVQRALAHPVRAQILAELRERRMSPSQLADAVGESVAVASYHVRTLAEAGLVELVDTVPKRGAIQHFYAARDDATVGATLMLDSDRADSLQRDLRARIDEARRSATEQPGDVAVTIVLHAVESGDS